MKELERWRRKVEEADKELSELAKTSSSTIAHTEQSRTSGISNGRPISSRAPATQSPVLERLDTMKTPRPPLRDDHSRGPSSHHYVSRGEKSATLHPIHRADDPCGWEKRPRTICPGRSAPDDQRERREPTSQWTQRMEEFEQLGVPRQLPLQGRPIAKPVHKPSSTELSRRQDGSQQKRDQYEPTQPTTQTKSCPRSSHFPMDKKSRLSSIFKNFLRTDGAPQPAEIRNVQDPNMSVEEFLRSKRVQVRTTCWGEGQRIQNTL